MEIKKENRRKDKEIRRVGQEIQYPKKKSRKIRDEEMIKEIIQNNFL